MRDRLSTRGIAIVLAALLFTVLTLPAAAADSVRGWGVAMERDLDAGTLTIDGTKFKVVGGTTFKDLEGNVIAFADLPIIDITGGLFALEDASLVEFVARRNAGHMYLVSVKRVRELPR